MYSFIIADTIKARWCGWLGGILVRSWISAVFFNLFSEPEHFAAILIAHETHVFLAGGLLRPEGPKFKAEGREPGAVLLTYLHVLLTYMSEPIPVVQPTVPHCVSKKCTNFETV